MAADATEIAAPGCRRCGAAPDAVTCRFEKHDGHVYPVQLVCTVCGAEGERREPGGPVGHHITVTDYISQARRLDCECGWSKRCHVLNVAMYRSFHWSDVRDQSQSDPI